MNVVCPGCGSRFEPDLELLERALKVAYGEIVTVTPLELQADGTAFRALRPGEERHIDQRLRCPRCAFHQR